MSGAELAKDATLKVRARTPYCEAKKETRISRKPILIFAILKRGLIDSVYVGA